MSQASTDLKRKRTKNGRFIKASHQEQKEKAAEGRRLAYEKRQRLMAVENAFENERVQEETETWNDFVKEVKMQGRRVIDIFLLWRDMWCLVCKRSLGFREIISEATRGLAYIWTLRCPQCLQEKQVETSNTYLSAETNRSRYVANAKVMFGMNDSGVGTAQFNKILSALDIPCLDAGTLKRVERDVGKVVHAVAKESCVEALTLEKELTLKSPLKLLPPPSNPDEDGIAEEGSPTTPLAVDQTPENRFQFPEVRSATTTTPRRRVEIGVSYDMQFSTRGNGKRYDSLSAVGSMFGTKSKKCCGFTTMTRKCWSCEEGVPHECEGVFKGSAKAMEPEAAVRLVVRNNDLDEVGVVVKALAGDDDASTMAAIKRVCPHYVEKWHDHNHTQKHVKNDLYKVMGKFSKLFKAAYIPYFVHSYGVAVKQNVGSAESVRSAISAITPHSFGDHSKCKVSWCGYLQNPSEFKHKYFGNDGAALTGEALRDELSALFEKYAVRAEGIAPGASSQRNESANSVFISKAPKRTFTGGTSRYRSQVSAAVAQINKGTQYAGKVFEKLNFSPSTGGQKYRIRVDIARARLAGYKGTPAFKSRRKVLVIKRNSLKSMLENGEGVLYESGMGFKQPVPDNVPCGGEVCQVQDTPLPAVSGLKFVFFDTETSGHGEIVQIACKCEGQSGAKFSAYGYPTQGIAKKASEVNHLSIIRGELCFNNRPVKGHTSTYKMMNLFFEYLQSLESPAVLVAHNASADLYPLINLCSYYFALPRLAQLVVGVSDTLPLMRAHPVVLHDFSISQANAGEGPDNKKKQPLASQSYLAKKYVPGFNSLKAHEALYDCKILEQLCVYLEVDREYLAKNIKPLSAYVNRVIELDNVKKLLGGLKENFKSKDISSGTLTKLAEQGLTMRALALKLNNEGPQSFSLFLSKKINNRKSTISAIVDKVTTFLERERESERSETTFLDLN